MVNSCGVGCADKFNILQRTQSLPLTRELSAQPTEGEINFDVKGSAFFAENNSLPPLLPPEGELPRRGKRSRAGAPSSEGGVLLGSRIDNRFVGVDAHIEPL